MLVYVMEYGKIHTDRHSRLAHQNESVKPSQLYWQRADFNSSSSSPLTGGCSTGCHVMRLTAKMHCVLGSTGTCNMACGVSSWCLTVN